MDLVHVGKIVAAHGVQGELIIAHFLGENKRQSAIKSILLEDKNGSRVPWFIQSIVLRSLQNEWIIKLEGITRREQVTGLLKKKVFLHQADFDNCVSKQAPQSLIGYIIIENGKVIGAITHIHEQQHQLIAITEYNGREVLIPLHSETLVRVDRKQKHVYVSLPEGLLDIYA